jgi:hypothetical protein
MYVRNNACIGLTALTSLVVLVPARMGWLGEIRQQQNHQPILAARRLCDAFQQQKTARLYRWNRNSEENEGAGACESTAHQASPVFWLRQRLG